MFQHFPPFPQQSPPPVKMPVNEVPARVSAAMEFLMQLTYKTKAVVAVTSVGSEEYVGQKLTTFEQDAQKAACSLLVSYFNGNMGSDQFESLYNRVVTSMTQIEENEPPPMDDTTGILPCPHCAQNGHRDKCPMCRGFGRLKIVPFGGS